MFYGGYGTDIDANFYPRGCGLHAGLRHERRPPDGLAPGMRLVRSLRRARRHGARGAARRSSIAPGNVLGVHFYDEPGLTWATNPETGEVSPHGIPAQVRSSQSASISDAPHYQKIDPNNPSDVAAWKEWRSWKLGFMDAAWQDATVWRQRTCARIF
ncbi:MAG: hypothetical protein WKG07_33800 [Hymenobacter sp.]